MLLPASCSVAYDFLCDYRNDARWRLEVSDVQLLTGSAGEKGARYFGRLEWNGIDVPHELEIVEADRPSKILIRSESPNLLIDVEYSLQDRGARCELTATYTLDMGGPLRVVEPFGWALLMGWARDDLPHLPVVLADGMADAGP